MAKQTAASVKTKNHEVSLHSHETDSPVIPVVQLEQLHQFRPDKVDWIFQQTQIEAEFRRSEIKRVNKFSFVGVILGQIFAFLLGMAAYWWGCLWSNRGASLGRWHYCHCFYF